MLSLGVGWHFSHGSICCVSFVSDEGGKAAIRFAYADGIWRIGAGFLAWLRRASCIVGAARTVWVVRELQQRTASKAIA